MKKIFAILVALLMMLLTLPALAETDDATVSVTGNGVATLVPDMATFTVGVSTQDAQVQTAQAANAAAMTKVLDALKALGLTEKDMQTDNYSVNPVYDYQTGKFGDQQTLTGYMVSNTATVTVRALDQLPALLDAAVAAGANQVYGVSFDSTARDAAYDQAMTAAAQDALRKAKLLAQAVGREAGDIVTLAEGGSSYQPYASAKAVSYDSAMATPVEVGTMTVTASVSIVVALR